MRRILCWAALLAVLETGLVLAEPPTFKPTFDLRLRSESWDAPARTTTSDSSYGFSLVRARLGVDLAWKHWTLHGMLQASGAVGLPENGSFGAGPTYVTANDGDTDFGVIGIAELSAIYQREGLRLVLGRQPYLWTADGVCYRETGEGATGTDLTRTSTDWHWRGKADLEKRLAPSRAVRGQQAPTPAAPQ